jgi:ABC-type sugar transport system ATPase subunit
MVFQSYALYPHMSVFQNISYPLKLQKVPKDEMRTRTQRVADMMGIGHLMDRKPAQLSGGQQQRVALGRALVKEPNLLLFDEPLSNLDARLRLSMRGEIKRLQMELGITSIYVTHDQVEAMTMADRIAVIKDGKLQAYAQPDMLYEQPRTLFIAGFVGNPPMNFVEVEVASESDGYHARREGLDLLVPSERGEKAVGDERVILGIRPEDVTLADDGIPGEVYVVEPLGRDDLLDVHIGEASIRVLADPTLRIRIGDTVRLGFNTEKVQFFDPVTEKSLLWA